MPCGGLNPGRGRCMQLGKIIFSKAFLNKGLVEVGLCRQVRLKPI